MTLKEKFKNRLSASVSFYLKETDIDTLDKGKAVEVSYRGERFFLIKSKKEEVK